MKISKILLVISIATFLIAAFLYFKPQKKTEYKSEHTFLCISKEAEKNVENVTRVTERLIKTDEYLEIKSITETITLEIEDEKLYKKYEKNIKNSAMTEYYDITYDPKNKTIKTRHELKLIDKNSNPVSIWYINYEKGLSSSFSCEEQN